MSTALADPKWRVMHVELVDEPTRDRRLQTYIAVFAGILALLSGASIGDQRAYAELLCRISRRIRLRICACPKVDGMLHVPREVASNVKQMFEEARDTIKPIVPQHDDEFAEYERNLGRRCNFMTSLVDALEVEISDFADMDEEADQQST